MENFQVLSKLCLYGVLIFTILAALCAFGWNHYGLKIKELEKDTSGKTTNNYNIKGDLINGNKIITKTETKTPNALIVTQNHSGGQHTVNYYQNEFRPLDKAIDKK